MTDKIAELFFLAVIVAIFASALFETIKERFLKLKVSGKMTVLFSLAVVAVGVILVEQHVPKFEALHFTIPVPVPNLHQFSIQQVTITTHAPLLEAIAFGLIMTFVSIADALHAGARFRAANPQLTPSAHFREYSRSPLVLYPLLALSYKVLVIGSGPSVSMACMYAASILGLLFTPLFWKNRSILREQIPLILFAVLFAAALTFAALL